MENQYQLVWLQKQPLNNVFVSLVVWGVSCSSHHLKCECNSELPSTLIHSRMHPETVLGAGGDRWGGGWVVRITGHTYVI